MCIRLVSKDCSFPGAPYRADSGQADRPPQPARTCKPAQCTPEPQPKALDSLRVKLDSTGVASIVRVERMGTEAAFASGMKVVDFLPNQTTTQLFGKSPPPYVLNSRFQIHSLLGVARIGFFRRFF